MKCEAPTRNDAHERVCKTTTPQPPREGRYPSPRSARQSDEVNANDYDESELSMSIDVNSWSKKLQHRWRFLAIVAAVALVASACGGESSDEAPSDTDTEAAQPDDTADQGEDDQEPVVLSYSWWGGDNRNEYTHQVADLFEDANPSVTIERSPTDWAAYWERLAVEASAKTEPDIISMHPNNLANFASEGVLLSLDDLIADGTLDVSAVPEGVLQLGRVDGVQYMIPIGAAYSAIAYDSDALEADGVSPPPDDWTWDAYFAWLEEWAAASPEGAPWPMQGYTSSSADQAFYGYLLSQGVQPYTEEGQLGFEAEHLADWYTKMQRMRDVGAYPPMDVAVEEVTQTLEDSMIVRGRVHATNLSANGMATFQEMTEGHLVLMPMPGGPAGSGQVLFPAGLSISANSENPAEAAKFISYFVTDPEAGAAYRADNGVPVTASQRDHMLETGSVPDAQIEVFELWDKIGDSLPAMNQVPEAAPALTDALQRYHHEVGFGRMTPEEAAQAFFDEVEAQFSGG